MMVGVDADAQCVKNEKYVTYLAFYKIILSHLMV